MERHIVRVTDLWAYVSLHGNKHIAEKVESWIASEDFYATLYSKIHGIHNILDENPYAVINIEDAKQRFFISVKSECPKAGFWKKVKQHVATISFVKSIALYANYFRTRFRKNNQNETEK